VKIFLILGILSLIIPSTAFSEQFYYFEDHKVMRNPVVCAFEFEDKELPIAEKQLLEETKNAVLEWKNKLTQFTGDEDSWKMEYKVFPKEKQHDFFAEYDCDITIYFERDPLLVVEVFAGYTDIYPFGLSEILILYLQPIFSDEVLNSETLQNAEPIGLENSIDLYVGETIRHEFGHALGLDHLPKEAISYDYKNGIPVGSSIMIDDLDGLPWNIVFEITEYDLRALVNLYGEGGFKVPFSLWFLNIIGYLILGGIIVLIVFLIIRSKRKRSARSNLM